MRVLVAIDGSSQAWEALGMLRALSATEGVVLVHAIDPVLPAMAAGAEVYVPYTADLENVLREHGENVLAEGAARLPENIAVTRRLVTGSAADVILSTAETEMVELVIVGARGLGRVRELVLGSVSHRVLYHAACPVMVVRGTAKTAVRRVLAPVQGEEDVARLVRFLKKVPFPGSLEIRVLHVVPVADPLWPLDAVTADKHAREEIERTATLARAGAETLSALGHKAVGVTGLGASSESILREAESFGADLVLMGARGRSDVSRFLLGSVSHSVLHQAGCPVLILR
jgi:nucleotide-binding universal stress UspA family protein